MSKAIIGFFAYIVVTFAWGFIWNLILFKDKYREIASTSLRPEPIIPLGFIAIIVQALTIVYLYRTIFPLEPSLKMAMTLSIGFGVFLIAYAAFVVPAKFEIVPSWQYVVLELVFGGVHVAVVGAMFYFIFKEAKAG